MVKVELVKRTIGLGVLLIIILIITNTAIPYVFQILVGQLQYFIIVCFIIGFIISYLGKVDSFLGGLVNNLFAWFLSWVYFIPFIIFQLIFTYLPYYEGLNFLFSISSRGFIIIYSVFPLVAGGILAGILNERKRKPPLNRVSQ